MQFLTSSKTDPTLLSPLTLAFIGDGVYELLAREHVIAKGSMPAGKLHRLAVNLVCAAAQAQAYQLIEPYLSEKEEDILRRGRNANSTAVPRRSNPADYRRATGVEALFGYLYLSDQIDRINTLFAIILEGAEGNIDGQS